MSCKNDARVSAVLFSIARNYMNLLKQSMATAMCLYLPCPTLVTKSKDQVKRGPAGKACNAPYHQSVECICSN